MAKDLIKEEWGIGEDGTMKYLHYSIEGENLLFMNLEEWKKHLSSKDWYDATKFETAYKDAVDKRKKWLGNTENI